MARVVFASNNSPLYKDRCQSIVTEFERSSGKQSNRGKRRGNKQELPFGKFLLCKSFEVFEITPAWFDGAGVHGAEPFPICNATQSKASAQFVALMLALKWWLEQEQRERECYQREQRGA